MSRRRAPRTPVAPPAPCRTVRLDLAGDARLYVHDADPDDVRSRIASAAAVNGDVRLPDGRRIDPELVRNITAIEPPLREDAA